MNKKVLVTTVIAGALTVGIVVNLLMPSPPSKLNQVTQSQEPKSDVSEVTFSAAVSIAPPPTPVTLPPLPDDIQVYLDKAKILSEVKQEAELAEAKARVRRADQEGRDEVGNSLGLAALPKAKRAMPVAAATESQPAALQVRGITQKGQSKVARVWFRQQWHTVKKGQRFGPYTVTRIQDNQLTVRSEQGSETFTVGG
ncbi:hypothetical protein GCM10007938_40180 [Vibrio zhanjiangensis]|uniref:Type IV pilus biogenesis protein PilP n=1 Tax=Vibrio zhanjiangensis TaxID=1046128 RepID=A0ABQ6F5U7_9VIBR|nr:hypothetical protein [Vibrio zhanjiangensis]GLT20235.1 hypothetical protein GCM10007938_40180 [Vibrio zhanjiangensis]